MKSVVLGPWVVICAILAWAVTARAEVHGALERYVIPCNRIETRDGKVPAPEFCDDLANVHENRRAAVRAELTDYIKSITGWDAAAGDQQELQDVTGQRVTGAVHAALGSRLLTEADLARRGRIVARILTNAPYEHGIRESFTYVWVDYRLFRGWRVLMIPERPEEPISVLSNYEIGVIPDTTHRRSVEFFSDTTAWFESMSDEVKECYTDSLRACWVNGKTPRIARIKSDEFLPSDAWVWVTDYGCVCVGSKCHASKKGASGETE